MSGYSNTQWVGDFPGYFSLIVGNVSLKRSEIASEDIQKLQVRGLPEFQEAN